MGKDTDQTSNSGVAGIADPKKSGLPFWRSQSIIQLDKLEFDEQNQHLFVFSIIQYNFVQNVHLPLEYCI